MRFFAGFVFLLGSALAHGQDVPDATIDQAVAAVKGGLDYERLQELAHGNWPRVLWNYRHANGAGRSRILSAVHYGGAPLWSPLLPLAAKDPGWQNRQTAALLVERTAQDPNQRPRIVTLQKKLATDSAWQVRMTVAAGLQWQGAPDVKPMLIKLGRDEHRFVRVQAAMSLGRMKDTRAIPLLIQALGEDEGFSDVQVLAYDGWGPGIFLLNFGKKALPAVLPLLKSKSAKARQSGLGLLIEFQSDGVISDLFERAVAFLQDPDPGVRLTALRALAQNRNPEGLPYLVKALEDKDRTVASTVEDWMRWGLPWEHGVWPEAKKALEKYEPIDKAVAALGSYQTQDDTEFVRLARDNWPRVVWHYRQANGALRSRLLSAAHYGGGNNELNPLIEAACDDPGWANRQIAAMLVERIANDRNQVQTVEALQRKLAKDRDWRVRIVVAAGLQWQYQPSVKPLLIELTRDPHEFVRIQAAISLGRLKDERAIPLLIAALGNQGGFDKDVSMYNSGWGPQNFLVEFGMKAVPGVLKALGSHSPKQKQGALEVLIGMEELQILKEMKPSLFEQAKKLVDDPAPWVRYTALRAMSWNHNNDAIPYLVRALKDKAELAPRSPVSLNVRNLLECGPEVDSKPWPEGLAALKAAGGE